MLERWNRGAARPPPLTPVSAMRSFWGLVRAYWFSERWKEAWGLAAVIAALTALSSKSGVWFAEASGELVNSIAYFHESANPAPLETVLSNAATLVLLVLLKDAGFTGVRHFFSTTLHRKWRSWLNERFNQALLDRNHTHFHVQNGASGDAESLDNIDQRIQESIKDMTGGSIGLAMGVIGVATSLLFVGQKLVETSTRVEGLEFFGDYGSAFLAFAAVAVYVPFNTWIAVKMGGLLERLSVKMQQAEGSYRAELTMFLRRSFSVAASDGEGVQIAVHRRRYVDIDRTWGSMNVVNAGFMSFELVYNFVGARVVAYGPGLLPYAIGSVDLKKYITGAELVNSLIGQCSWFIHVMPAIATLKANSRRVTALAAAIEDVQRPREFYGRSGTSDFRYGFQDPKFGLTVRDLSLFHQGRRAAPFLSAENLHFRRGEWAFLKGESGSGKTSLIKAINGLWPYGSGMVILPQGIETFFAVQEVKFPQVSLKELVCLPGPPCERTDDAVARVLAAAGLGEFAGELESEGRENKPWDQLLSGGQKQKLVCARILLRRPGLLFLDEATGALDCEGKTAFHQAIKDGCPETTVISVMHEAATPKSAEGREFYDSVVSISGGAATKSPLVLPAPLAPAPGRPRHTEAGRFRTPRMRLGAF